MQIDITTWGPVKCGPIVQLNQLISSPRPPRFFLNATFDPTVNFFLYEGLVVTQPVRLPLDLRLITENLIAPVSHMTPVLDCSMASISIRQMTSSTYVL